MRTISVLALVAALGVVGCASNVVTPLPPIERPPEGTDPLPANMGWVQVWADEFNGADLDFKKWEIEESCWGGGNEERQCYTARFENVEVSNGVLRLKAFRETVRGPKYPREHPEGQTEKVTQKYSSGKVRTLDKAAWTYGRFSARMKLPKGQGTWPAFWMLPVDNEYGPWAASGEIDIMEAVNLGERCDVCVGDEGENRTSGALHFGGSWPRNEFKVEYHPLPGGRGAVEDYHVYSVEWGEGQINWFIDDELFYTLTSEDWDTEGVKREKNPAAPFDRPFYLMLNYAVGGKLSETNNKKGFDPSSFPSEVLVDWVRVYSCEQDPQTGLSCMMNRQD